MTALLPAVYRYKNSLPRSYAYVVVCWDGNGDFLSSPVENSKQSPLTGYYAATDDNRVVHDEQRI
jgi:hypothetical protein